ncbi:MAG: hypothetical protein WCJ37_03000 [Syntrophus sp. (in: bacteria)]
MLSGEIERFINQWMNRAQQYTDTNIDGCYDKFFTLFVVFNRLYAEATFELARRGSINLAPNRPLPDKKGATEYTLEVIGLDNFENLYRSNLSEPVQTIANLIESERFYIILSSPNGDIQPEKDQALLHDLKSTGKTRALAILEVMYKVRCNLFHGHKSFHPIQTDLLKPTICILEKIITALRNRLQA